LEIFLTASSCKCKCSKEDAVWGEQEAKKGGDSHQYAVRGEQHEAKRKEVVEQYLFFLSLIRQRYW
jgi:hypothetical protein